ncbi:right-handed parallel beta-helix repeat-containing protein, partial [bacterium]
MTIKSATCASYTTKETCPSASCEWTDPDRIGWVPIIGSKGECKEKPGAQTTADKPVEEVVHPVEVQPGVYECSTCKSCQAIVEKAEGESSHAWTVRLTKDIDCSNLGGKSDYSYIDGMTIDCQGHKISKTGWVVQFSDGDVIHPFSDIGIRIGANTVVKNCRIEGFSRGIFCFGDCSGAKIIGNNITNCGYGIHINAHEYGGWSSLVKNVEISSNVIVHNQFSGIWSYGHGQTSADSIFIENNLVCDNDLYARSFGDIGVPGGTITNNICGECEIVVSQLWVRDCNCKTKEPYCMPPPQTCPDYCKILNSKGDSTGEIYLCPENDPAPKDGVVYRRANDNLASNWCIDNKGKYGGCWCINPGGKPTPDLNKLPPPPTYGKVSQFFYRKCEAGTNSDTDMPISSSGINLPAQFREKDGYAYYCFVAKDSEGYVIKNAKWTDLEDGDSSEYEKLPKFEKVPGAEEPTQIYKSSEIDGGIHKVGLSGPFKLGFEINGTRIDNIKFGLNDPTLTIQTPQDQPTTKTPTPTGKPSIKCLSSQGKYECKLYDSNNKQITSGIEWSKTEESDSACEIIPGIDTIGIKVMAGGTCPIIAKWNGQTITYYLAMESSTKSESFPPEKVQIVDTSFVRQDPYKIGDGDNRVFMGCDLESKATCKDATWTLDENKNTEGDEACVLESDFAGTRLRGIGNGKCILKMSNCKINGANYKDELEFQIGSGLGQTTPAKDSTTSSETTQVNEPEKEPSKPESRETPSAEESPSSLKITSSSTTEWKEGETKTFQVSTNLEEIESGKLVDWSVSGKCSVEKDNGAEVELSTKGCGKCNIHAKYGGLKADTSANIACSRLKIYAGVTGEFRKGGTTGWSYSGGAVGTKGTGENWFFHGKDLKANDYVPMGEMTWSTIGPSSV